SRKAGLVFVHAPVRDGAQPGEVVSIGRKHRDSEAGRDEHGDVAHADGAGHRLPQPPGNLPGGFRVGHVKQDGEFVTAQAGGRFPGPDVVVQALRHDFQDFVARLVPVTVIDGLETVQVQEYKGGTAVALPHAQEEVAQVPAVAYARQVVHVHEADGFHESGLAAVYRADRDEQVPVE